MAAHGLRLVSAERLEQLEREVGMAVHVCNRGSFDPAGIVHDGLRFLEEEEVQAHHLRPAAEVAVLCGAAFPRSRDAHVE